MWAQTRYLNLSNYLNKKVNYTWGKCAVFVTSCQFFLIENKTIDQKIRSLTKLLFKEEITYEITII